MHTDMKITVTSWKESKNQKFTCKSLEEDIDNDDNDEHIREVRRGFSIHGLESKRSRLELMRY